MNATNPPIPSDAVWSTDGENFKHADFCEVLRELDDLGELEVGRVVEFATESVPGTDFVDADIVIDGIANAAYDMAGEFAEDFPDINAEAREELESFLDEWQAKHCVPTFWLIHNATKYTITEADILEYRGEGVVVESLIAQGGAQ